MKRKRRGRNDPAFFLRFQAQDERLARRANSPARPVPSNQAVPGMGVAVLPVPQMLSPPRKALNGGRGERSGTGHIEALFGKPCRREQEHGGLVVAEALGSAVAPSRGERNHHIVLAWIFRILTIFETALAHPGALEAEGGSGDFDDDGDPGPRSGERVGRETAETKKGFQDQT
jgi:hypothetical protein